MLDIDGEYTIQIQGGEIVSVVRADGQRFNRTDDKKMPPRVRPAHLNLHEDEQIPNDVSLCINLGNIIDDPATRCVWKWGTWW